MTGLVSFPAWEENFTKGTAKCLSSLHHFHQQGGTFSSSKVANKKGEELESFKQCKE